MWSPTSIETAIVGAGAHARTCRYITIAERAEKQDLIDGEADDDADAERPLDQREHDGDAGDRAEPDKPAGEEGAALDGLPGRRLEAAQHRVLQQAGIDHAEAEPDADADAGPGLLQQRESDEDDAAENAAGPHDALGLGRDFRVSERRSRRHPLGVRLHIRGRGHTGSSRRLRRIFDVHDLRYLRTSLYVDNAPVTLPMTRPTRMKTGVVPKCRSHSQPRKIPASQHVAFTVPIGHEPEGSQAR